MDATTLSNLWSLWYTIWDDVRTYITSQIDPDEKTALLVAISHFKKEEKQ